MGLYNISSCFPSLSVQIKTYRIRPEFEIGSSIYFFIKQILIYLHNSIDSISNFIWKYFFWRLLKAVTPISEVSKTSLVRYLSRIIFCIYCRFSSIGIFLFVRDQLWWRFYSDWCNNVLFYTKERNITYLSIIKYWIWLAFQ